MVSLSGLKLLFSLLKLLFQKCHPYIQNLTSETPGDTKTVFLYCGDVSDIAETNKQDVLTAK